MFNLNSEIDSNTQSSPSRETMSSQTTHIQHSKAESDEPVFTLFPKLPPELRLKIIQIASNLPRILYIQLTGPKVTGTRLPYFCRDPVPAVLHVSQEFRKEALKSYKLTFPARPTNGEMIEQPGVYYNSDADVFFLMSVSCRGLNTIK